MGRRRTVMFAGLPRNATLSYMRLRERDINETPDTAWSWVEQGYELFPEARQDKIRWNYDPMDPWRMVFTPGISPIDIDINGEHVLTDGVPTRVDPDEIRAKAAEAAQRLFAKLEV